MLKSLFINAVKKSISSLKKLPKVRDNVFMQLFYYENIISCALVKDSLAGYPIQNPAINDTSEVTEKNLYKKIAGLLDYQISSIDYSFRRLLNNNIYKQPVLALEPVTIGNINPKNQINPKAFLNDHQIIKEENKKIKELEQKIRKISTDELKVIKLKTIFFLLLFLVSVNLF